MFSYIWRMMTSFIGIIFRVTVHLCGEFTGHRWIPRTKASDAELWCFLWSAPEWTVAKASQIPDNSTLCLTACSNTKHILVPHYWPFVRGIHSGLRTQDSGQAYSTQNYTWKYYIRITLQNNTSMLNKYGPDIIKNAEMHVGRPLLRS